MHSEQVFNLLTKEYTFILATTSQDFQSVKRIREEVYSSKYNQPLEFLNSIGVLFSKEDKQSFIYLLKHNKTNIFVGTVRVFFINSKTLIQKLPLQQTVKSKNIKHLLQELPVVEISRGALIQNLPQHKTLSALQLRTILTYSLMIATRINFLLYPSLKVFSIMEFAMYRILKRQQVNFQQIADSVDSYGTKRTPYAIERKKLLKDTEGTMGKLTRHYLKQLCQDPEPFWQFIDNNPYLERSDIQLDRICQLFKEYGDDVDLALLLEEKVSRL
jgi:N-acyl amino acid synthase of PEP-CTERM/exosortase system